jgi:hypothetical protein
MLPPQFCDCPVRSGLGHIAELLVFPLEEDLPTQRTNFNRKAVGQQKGRAKLTEKQNNC